MPKPEQQRMTRRETQRQQRKRKQMVTRITFLGAILLAAVLLVAFIAIPAIRNQANLRATQTAQANLPISLKTPEPVDHPQASGTAMGDPNAPVRVDVYEDFQCPACGIYSQEVESLVIQQYVATGQVYYVYHHYPFLDDRSSTKESDQSANGSMCAADQGKFWEYHDLLYANQSGENQGAFRDKVLVAMAENIGLDMDQFNECFESNAFEAQIDDDIASGRALGVNSTPSVFVDRLLVKPGFAPSIVDLQQAIDAALNN
jgi:protein-disulfide isomerase